MTRPLDASVATQRRPSSTGRGAPATARLAPGDPAPDFGAVGPEGDTIRLGDHRGRPLLLIFLRHLA